MIKIEAKNETSESFDLEVDIRGIQGVLTIELTAIFDDIYNTNPKLFEKALGFSKYTRDHT